MDYQVFVVDIGLLVEEVGKGVISYSEEERVPEGFISAARLAA